MDCQYDNSSEFIQDQLNKLGELKCDKFRLNPMNRELHTATKQFLNLKKFEYYPQDFCT